MTDPEPLSHLQPFAGELWWHPDVDDGYVRMVLIDRVQQVACAADARDDVDALTTVLWILAQAATLPGSWNRMAGRPRT